jgi:fatty-acyl-CoA synthase
MISFQFVTDPNRVRHMIRSNSAPDLPAEHLPALLRHNAQVRPDAPAVITATTVTTFADLARRAEAVARALRAEGIADGDRVAMLMGNRVEFLEFLFGIGIAGATAVPFSTWSTLSELKFLIADSSVKLIVAQEHFGDRSFIADLTTLEQEADDGQKFPRIIALASAEPFGVAPSEGAEPLPGPHSDADAMILYTSGSSSRPKGVRLVHRHVCENGFYIGQRQGLGADDRVFLAAPLFWSYGGANALPAAFSHGAALVLADRFEPGSALRLIARHACTAIYTLPAMTDAMLRHPDFKLSATRSLRTGLTIGGQTEMMAAIDGLGVPEICNIYGATETYGNCAVTWHHWPVEKRAACQGPPLPGHVIRLRDPSDETLVEEAGREGQVEVGGIISPGYIGANAALNSEIFTKDGFYRTGDLGRLNADGSFVFVGRSSEMIKRAGINVSPAEVEDAFRNFPEIAQCCVVGVPDAVRGEVIVAFVIVRDGVREDADVLMKQAQIVLSKYKHPDHIVFCTEMPLTATGKLQRKVLKDEGLRLFSASLKGLAS